MGTETRMPEATVTVNLYRFEVEGTGPFPFDMLRYDRCWPCREDEDSSSLGRVDYNEYSNEPRRIQLYGMSHPHGDRWASFGWRLVPENAPPLEEDDLSPTGRDFFNAGTPLKIGGDDLSPTIPDPVETALDNLNTRENPNLLDAHHQLEALINDEVVDVRDLVNEAAGIIDLLADAIESMKGGTGIELLMTQLQTLDSRWQPKP